MRKLILAAGLSLAAIAPANAATVLNDNFDGENGGNTALQYTGFANFNVVSTGVDIVKNGDFGIACSGICIDLDGSPGPGGILSTASYNFNAGDLVRLTYDVGGSQRGGSNDSFDVRYFFASSTTLLNAGSSFGGGPDQIDFASITGTDYSNGFNVNANDPFSTNSIFFTAANAGSLTFQFASGSADNVGPLLDNIVLDVSAPVPEPATWAMMIFGFGLIGSAMRRRRNVAVKGLSFG